MVITPTNCLPRLLLDQTVGHHSLAKLAHKINCCTGAKGFPEAEEAVRVAETQRYLSPNPFILEVVAPHLHAFLVHLIPCSGSSNIGTSVNGFCCARQTVWGFCFSNLHLKKKNFVCN